MRECVALATYRSAMSWPPTPPPPGWFPDPSGQPQLRWWDGAAWTSHTAAPSAPVPSPVRVAPQGKQVVTQAGVFELAGWWLRFAGYVIDAIILDVPLVVVGAIIGFADVATQTSVSGSRVVLGTGSEVLVVVVSVVLTIGYPFLMLRFRGQTVGMMAVGARAVDSVSGSPLTRPQTWARVLTFFALSQLWTRSPP